MVIWVIGVWLQWSVGYCLRVGLLSRNRHAAVLVHAVLKDNLAQHFSLLYSQNLTAHSFIQLRRFSWLSGFVA